MSAETRHGQEAGLSRRHFLWNSGGGLGGIALAWMLAREARADTARPGSVMLPHFKPRAKRVVQVFCLGGVSHIDTFDYKPELEKMNGKSLAGKGENQGFFGQPGNLMKSPWAFKQYGESGAWVSDLMPNIAGCVDDIAFIKSMVARSNNHTPATFQMNTGFTMNGFPCMGSWLSYGIGTENEDLPTFVVLPDPRGLPAGGSINWTAGFLPATHQGTAFRTGRGEPIVDLATPRDVSAGERGAELRLLGAMNRRLLERDPMDTALAARLRSYELAVKMQSSVPLAADYEQEPPSIQQMYGLDRPETAAMGRNCLLARRLLERGVRFVQLFNGGAFGSPRINWDGHENIVENHNKMALGVDRPVAALIRDLKQRGMLEDTLFIWTTEFGRGPATQGVGSTGRDHHPLAFTCFMVGAGVKAGTSYGGTDEVGYFASENPVQIPDFHATVLRLLGLDHKKLTYYHNGIQRRLTNVSGEVVGGVLG